MTQIVYLNKKRTCESLESRLHYLNFKMLKSVYLRFFEERSFQLNFDNAILAYDGVSDTRFLKFIIKKPHYYY